MMYRYSSIVFITSLVTFGISVGFFVFFSKQPVPPQYIPVNEDGTYMTLLPVADCNSKTEAEVKKFSMAGIKKLYKYDYINYAEQLQDASSFFTSQGWNDYLDAYTSSNVLLGVKENMWIVTVQPQGIPELIQAPKVEDGACIWELKAPIALSYIGKNSQNQKGDVILRISRVSVLQSPEGLGIKRLVFLPKQ